MPNMPYTENQIVEFEYHNHRGEYTRRRVVPVSLAWGASEWHPEPCWLLKAWDIERGAYRMFAWHHIQFAAKLDEAEEIES